MRELDWKAFDVLVVDDEEDNLDAFRFAFRKSFNLHYALGGEAALELIESIDPAVVVSDQRMPGMSGIELLTKVKERRPDTVGILLTAYADMPVLIDAVNSGAVERYIQKPWDSKELTVILRQAIGSFATVRENRRLREQVAHYAIYLEREQRDPIDFGEIAGESAAMKEVTSRIDEVSQTSSHVAIEAEPGSEIEVVARAIHVGSSREEKPFVKVTCAAFRGEALERELFGWRKNAFDGAFDDRAGRLDLADGGTVYLEEPDPLSPSLQARLLRLLANGEVERIGATEPTVVDVRVIVGISPNLSQAWRSGGLLPELASRLLVFPIHIPPLRERLGDVRSLATHFLGKYGQRNTRAATSLSNEAIEKLSHYTWPGNVRELENAIERAAILSRGDVIQPAHLAFDTGLVSRPPEGLAEDAQPSLSALSAGEVSLVDAAPGGQNQPVRIDLDSQLDDIERRELLAALARCGGNKAEVARTLGVRRTTLYYRLKRLGIEV